MDMQEFYYRSRGDPAFAPAIHLAAARDLIREDLRNS